MPHVFNFPEIAKKKYGFMAKAVQEKKRMNGEKQRFGECIECVRKKVQTKHINVLCHFLKDCGRRGP